MRGEGRARVRVPACGLPRLRTCRPFVRPVPTWSANASPVVAPHALREPRLCGRPAAGTSTGHSTSGCKCQELDSNSDLTWEGVRAPPGHLVAGSWAQATSLSASHSQPSEGHSDALWSSEAFNVGAPPPRRPARGGDLSARPARRRATDAAREHRRAGSSRGQVSAAGTPEAPVPACGRPSSVPPCRLPSASVPTSVFTRTVAEDCGPPR